MTTYTLTVEETPSSEDVRVLSQGLTAHALPYTQAPGFQPLGIFLRDEHGAPTAVKDVRTRVRGR